MANENSKHWSGAFQRLRAETVIISLLIASFTWFDVNLEKLPAIGVEFAHPVGHGLLSLILLAFWFYFVAAWFFRYHIEKGDVDSQIAIISGYMDEIHRLQLDVPERVFQHHPEYTKHLSEMERVATDLLNFQDNIRLVLGAQQERTGGCGTSSPKTSQPEITRWLQTTESGIIALRDLHADIAKAGEHFKEIYSQTEDRLTPILQHVQKTTTLLRKLGGLQSALAWDRKWLGFWLPLAFCIGIILFSLPQILRDVAPTLTHVYTCGRNLDIECLYRPQPLRLRLIDFWLTLPVPL